MWNADYRRPCQANYVLLPTVTFPRERKLINLILTPMSWPGELAIGQIYRAYLI